MDEYPFSPAWLSVLQGHEPLHREHHRITVGASFYGLMARSSQDRDGEVVLAVRRPDDRLLLHTKPFYPPDTWRMPTGGVEWGETPEEAAHREMAEETGLPGQVARLLGVLTYEMVAETAAAPVRFASAVFLVLAPDLPPAKQDPREQISGYSWVLPAELDQVAAQLRELPLDWGDWGRFRAPAHVLVAAALLPAQDQ